LAVAETKKRKKGAPEERDLPVLRLAASPFGEDRTAFYDDLAEVYGDKQLYDVACTLRERKLVGWGSNWTHCWLTEDGEAMLARHGDKNKAVA
jgi:hypothetical protein